MTTTLDLARARAGIDQVRVLHRPRLLSDNGPRYVSSALGAYLTQHGMTHPRGAPYHPMTQGKIERYHRSMKNVVKLDVYHSPWELERAIGLFVEHHNHCRLHESLQNVTPADMYAERQVAITGSGCPPKTAPSSASSPRPNRGSFGGSLFPQIAGRGNNGLQVLDAAAIVEVRGGGLEPPRVFSPLAPQTSASANSAILARSEPETEGTP